MVNKLETENYVVTNNNKVIIRDGVKTVNLEFWEDLIDAGIEKDNITEIEIPNSVKVLGFHAFSDFKKLVSVTVPESVVEIGDYAFTRCNLLTSVKLPTNLQSIGKEAFSRTNLSELIIPDSVKEIGRGAFSTTQIKSIKLPKSLKVLNGGVFMYCSELENVKFNEGLEVVDCNAFSLCEKIEKLNFPNSLKVLSSNSSLLSNFDGCTKLRELSFPLTTYIPNIEFNYGLDGVRLIGRYEGKDYVLQETKIKQSAVDKPKDKLKRSDFDTYTGPTVFRWDIGIGSNVIKFRDDKLVLIADDYKSLITTREELMKRATKTNELELLKDRQLVKLLPYLKYKFVPHKDVVLYFPKKEVAKFYQNGNSGRWAIITKKMQETNNDDKQTMLKLAYRLGVFSENVKESEIATKFICEAIMDKLSAQDIHTNFNNLPMETCPYNSNSAKFFMANYIKNPNFLKVFDDLEGVQVDYTAKMFNKFKKIQEAYPYKKVITRHNSDRLTVDLVLKVLTTAEEYEVHDERAKKLAVFAGRYGYTQEEYDNLEKWYIEGISIPEEKITLKIENDKVLEEINNTPAIVGDDLLGKVNGNKVTYELLKKDNPLGALIGAVTNCCQVVGGAGEQCVEYGMTKPNSSFLVFRDGNSRVLGQSWVWYDKNSGTICLDNIEVPHSVIESLQKNKEQQIEFLKCLLRVKQGFVNAMGVAKVKNVTIGKGFNDIAKLLDDNFEMSKNVTTLSNYDGYTDARDSQYIIPSLNKEQKTSIEQDKKEM